MEDGDGEKGEEREEGAKMYEYLYCRRTTEGGCRGNRQSPAARIGSEYRTYRAVSAMITSSARHRPSSVNHQSSIDKTKPVARWLDSYYSYLCLTPNKMDRLRPAYLMT